MANFTDLLIQDSILLHMTEEEEELFPHIVKVLSIEKQQEITERTQEKINKAETHY